MVGVYAFSVSKVLGVLDSSVVTPLCNNPIDVYSLDGKLLFPVGKGLEMFYTKKKVRPTRKIRHLISNECGNLVFDGEKKKPDGAFQIYSVGMGPLIFLHVVAPSAIKI